MLNYNDPKTADERSQTKPLTLEEEVRAVEILNSKEFSAAEEELIQRLLNNYQNLTHYFSRTSGLTGIR